MRLFSVILILAAFLPAAVSADMTDNQVDEILEFISDLDESVTWPEGRVSEGNGKLFVIAALGDTSLTASLKELNGKKSSAGHKIKVRTVSVDLLPSNAHILVISSPDENLVKKVLKQISGTGTLTITVGKDAGKHGAMVNLYFDDADETPKLKYELNLSLIKTEKLEFKKALIELAETVETD